MADPDVARLCWAMACEIDPNDVVIVGVATPMALAATWVAKELRTPKINFVAHGIVNPPIASIATEVSSQRNPRRQHPTLSQADLLQMLQGGTFSLQFISPAQVGSDGSINTSRLHPQQQILGGCLAIPDTAANVKRLIAFRLRPRPGFLVDNVDFKTAGPRTVTCFLDSKIRQDMNTLQMVKLPNPPAEVHHLLDSVIDPSGALKNG